MSADLLHRHGQASTLSRREEERDAAVPRRRLLEPSSGVSASISAWKPLPPRVSNAIDFFRFRSISSTYHRHQ